MARGNGRQKVVRDDADRRRLVDGLERTVVRYGWELLCYVIMGNHLHLLVKTPRPNLGAGMQSFLSQYGNRYEIGHLLCLRQCTSVRSNPGRGAGTDNVGPVAARGGFSPRRPTHPQPANSFLSRYRVSHVLGGGFAESAFVLCL